MILFIQNDQSVSAGTFETFLQKHSIPCTLWSADTTASYPNLDGVAGVITLGGHMGVHQRDEHPALDSVMRCMKEIIRRDIPHLAICLGAQLLAHSLGAVVRAETHSERGCCDISLTAEGLKDPLFCSIDSPCTALQWHKDSFTLPQGATLLAKSTACPTQSFRYGRSWAVQFHPEADEGVVAAWTKKVGAEPVHLDEFRQRSNDICQFGESLLKNFLIECDLLIFE